MFSLDSPITTVNNIGQKRAALYKKIGIETVYDLLHHFPRSYIDFTSAKSIDASKIGEIVTVSAKVIEKYTPTRVRGGMTIFKLIALDDSQNAITITFFNNKYAFNSIKLGQTYVFHGKLSGNMFRPEMSVPTFIPKTANTTMQPIYPLTAGLSNKMIANNIRDALLLISGQKATCLPDFVLQNEGFSNDIKAYSDIHFPKNINDAEGAKKLFILEELLCLQLGMSGLKNRQKSKSALKITNCDISEFYSSLPFTPTDAQIRAIDTALSDMQSESSMNRLLQGDVGSGKTLVAAALLYINSKNGGQGAFMAPTEILAVQHFNTLNKLLSPLGVKVSALTGSTTKKERERLFSELINGEIDIICGTHALIEKDVSFRNLSLVVADEQHRFGVAQRAALISKGSRPHTLIMSATPIPRSLALTIYGDLDISIIDEMPIGRQQTETYFIDSEKRQRALSFVEKELKKGNKAYIVCPAVEQSELEIESAIEYHEKISKLFADRNVALLHGRMKGKEKDAVMSEFKYGDTDILVSTTVIEVGVDVPNATIMMIENADRFGLSQLHQLRGRVGRGKDKSYCILVSDSKGENAVNRLKLMCKTTDGFEISKFDLKQRGPGDFFGDRQHGLPPLKTADLISDSFLLEKAQKYSAQILSNDQKLQNEANQALKEKVNSLFRKLSHGRNN